MSSLRLYMSVACASELADISEEERVLISDTGRVKETESNSFGCYSDVTTAVEAAELEVTFAF